MGKITVRIRILVRKTLARMSATYRHVSQFLNQRHSRNWNEYIKEIWGNLISGNPISTAITKDPLIVPTARIPASRSGRHFHPKTGIFISRTGHQRKLNSQVSGSNLIDSLKKSHKIRELLDSLITRVKKAVAAEAGFIVTFDPIKDQFTLWGQNDHRGGNLATADYKSIRSCVNRAHESNQMVFRLANTGRLRSLVCIPITSLNRSFIYLVLANKRTEIAFSCSDVRKANRIAENMICAFRLHFRYAPKSLAAIINENSLRAQLN